MNRAQRTILLIGLTLLVLEILFPPFKWSLEGRTWASKHSFVLAPPEALDLTIGRAPATIDTARWILHGMTLILGTAFVFLLFRSWRLRGERDLATPRETQ